MLLDEGANWKGAGTALLLAEAGHELTVVTPAGMVAKEVERTAADIPIRKRLRELGARLVTDAAVREWRGDAAVITQFAGAGRGDRGRHAGDRRLQSAGGLAGAGAGRHWTWTSGRWATASLPARR